MYNLEKYCIRISIFNSIVVIIITEDVKRHMRLLVVHSLLIMELEERSWLNSLNVSGSEAEVIDHLQGTAKLAIGVTGMGKYSLAL